METPIFSREFPEFLGNKWLRQDQILGDDMLIIWDVWKYTIHHYTGSWQTPLQRLFNRTRLVKKVYFWVKDRLKQKRVNSICSK